ncbi:hypothetical protein [Roseomonas sp. AR75]|uniref:hypothetical protein n=1 Tax=Roseomonas sp. AR75 TaxID=2562311 RepID=UPI0010C0A560|nr:hypothetical protein [Roseomonas sp. AR75]
MSGNRPRRPWEPPPPRPWGQEGALSPWDQGRARIEKGFSRFRHGTRGLLLPLFTWPLFFDAIWEIGTGDLRGLVAAALGIGLTIGATAVLRRGRHGDTRRAALMVGAATGLVAGLGAALNPLMAVLLGAGGWFGTRLLYDGAVQEAAPPVPPAPPGPLDEHRARLARIAAEPRLAGISGALAGVLDDLAARPDRITEARRFLVVHLDGLDRIRARLEAGAEPPEGLPKLLEDLTSAADELRDRIRAEETAALDIQVKVLSERLRQEGYA